MHPVYRQRPDLAIHKFARLMLARESIPVFGDGSSKRDYTHVNDIVSGIRVAMEYDKSDYEIINLGNNRTVSLIELIRELEKCLGVDATIERHPEQLGDVPQTWADTSRALEKLNFQPKISLKDGLLDFSEWIREAKCV